LKSTRPTAGQDIERYHQVEHFLNWQIRRPDLNRKTAALYTAIGFGKGKYVAERILRQEREWVQQRSITHGRRGKHVKVACMLEDEGTLMAAREYLEDAGERMYYFILILWQLK
jgi:hypothetical protein